MVAKKRKMMKKRTRRRWWEVVVGLGVVASTCEVRGQTMEGRRFWEGVPRGRCAEGTTLGAGGKAEGNGGGVTVVEEEVVVLLGASARSWRRVKRAVVVLGGRARTQSDQTERPEGRREGVA